jgi:hypothetical protein
MSDVLEIVGLLALITMGFLIALWLGFGILGVACLWASWSITRNRRQPERVRTIT